MFTTSSCLKMVFFGRKFCVKLSRVHLGQNEYSFTTFAHCIWDTAIMDFFGFITPPPFYNYNKRGGKGMYVRSGIALTPPPSNCAPTNSRKNAFKNQIWSYPFFCVKMIFSSWNNLYKCSVWRNVMLRHTWFSRECWPKSKFPKKG